MVIGWKKDELLSLRESFVAKAKACEDEKNRTDIIETIGMIDDLLLQIDPPKRPLIPFGKDPFKEAMKQNLIFMRDFGLFAPYVRDFAQKQSYLNDEEATISRAFNSSYSILNMTTEFFQTTDAQIASQYNSLIDGTNLKLKIMDGKTFEVGCTYPIMGTKLVYMYVSKINSLQDYITLAHEMTHGVLYYMNPETMSGMDRFIFIETIPIFMEMINNDYVAQRKGLELDGHNIKVLSFNDYLHAAEMGCALMDALSILPGKDLTNKGKVVNFLKQYRCFDEDDIKLVLHDCISEIFKYVNSYLAAVELYMIYLNNKEQAFDIIKKMAMVDTSDPRKYLEFLESIGIVPGANIGKYAQMLKENEKTLRK